MARRRKTEKVIRVRTCSGRDGISIEQAKRYWNRPGYGQTTRRATAKGAEWQKRGGAVVMYDRDDNRTTFKCEGGRIVGYTDYAEDLPRRRKRR